MSRTKYSAAPLRAALGEVLGDRLFGHSTKRLLITSYDIGVDDVHLFRTPHLTTLVRDWREKAVDVAMATTAAPTYFPGKALAGARLIDGGIWANNPSMVALTEAIGPLGLPLEAVRIFSVGTTTDLPTAAGGSTEADSSRGPSTPSMYSCVPKATAPPSRSATSWDRIMYCGSTPPCRPGSSSSIRSTRTA
ncbi:patatin-like phospholipase family protein [Mycobacterium intracellulare]|uniref:patatin-like phospholipase family protein n=1 Tax=Mycobacterium intracellulare TaxID=1767 RepID=UPI0039F63872